YSDGIERINIEQSIQNKLRMLDAVEDYLRGEMPQLCLSGSERTSITLDDNIIDGKKRLAREMLHAVRQRWQGWLENLDESASAMLADDAECAPPPGPQDTLLDVLQRRDLRVSYRQSMERPLKEVFSGNELAGVRERLVEIHGEIRSGRLVVATHMHAGDGNVHTNIPVNSNDYAMLQEAGRIVDRIMRLACDLGGVVSGEHGIGLTKIHYLDEAHQQAFADYKSQVDPNGHFNRGKLLPGGDLSQAYTPSLRLVQQEALILEASELGELNDLVKHCLRCGKCNPVCNTHVPRANLLYSPRNKILAAGLIIEAFLYEEQTRRGLSLRHFDEMEDVADHCTVCHKCLSPCPVDIDFGDVSIRMRSILRGQGRKRWNPGAWLAMQFLNTTDPRMVRVLKRLIGQWGFALQGLAHRGAARLGLLGDKGAPAPTTGPPTVATQVVNFVRKPLPAPVSAPPMRRRLGLEDARYIPIIRNPKRSNGSETVFYFPGCGSERLFADIGLASLAVLYHVGAETVLPPGYLCCGYPQRSGGDEKRGRAISVANQVLLHRVANTLNYLDIHTVLVSCGTCLDQLLTYQFQDIFPGCRVMDVHEYILEQGVGLKDGGPSRYLYHDPCHSPMKHQDPVKVMGGLLNAEVQLSDRCCGEAGTFAVTRADIATQVRHRKQEELERGAAWLRAATDDKDGKQILLTSCPSCQQGLSRYRFDTGLETRFAVVEFAERLLGPGWQDAFLRAAEDGGVERVLL
ncbi:MAG: FAD-linked oxidase, partial [Gammaproteobacteria bacterium]